jgi:hypothetical protein
LSSEKTFKSRILFRLESPVEKFQDAPFLKKKERKEAEINSGKMMVAVGHGGSGCAQSEVPPQKTL